MRRRIRRIAPDARLPVPTIGLAMSGGGGAAPAIQVDGTLAVSTDVGSYIASGISRINAVYIRCETPGTAGTTIIDIHLNGVTIFTVQANRPQLVWNDPDGVAKSGVPNITSLAENDVLTVEIDQVATGAEDLVVVIDLDLVVGLVGPAGAAGGAHDILDAAVHTDSALDAVTRGSIIVGNLTPKWDELLKGAAGRVLTAGALDLSWEVPAAGGTGVGFTAHLSANQDIPSGVSTTVQFDTEEDDLGGDFNVGTYTFTAPNSAPYQVSFAYRYLEDLADGSTEGFNLYKNAAVYLSTVSKVGGVVSCGAGLSMRMVLAATDTLHVDAFHTHGANRELAAIYCHFSAFQIA